MTHKDPYLTTSLPDLNNMDSTVSVKREPTEEPSKQVSQQASQQASQQVSQQGSSSASWGFKGGNFFPSSEAARFQKATAVIAQVPSLVAEVPVDELPPATGSNASKPKKRGKEGSKTDTQQKKRGKAAENGAKQSNESKSSSRADPEHIKEAKSKLQSWKDGIGKQPDLSPEDKKQFSILEDAIASEKGRKATFIKTFGADHDIIKSAQVGIDILEAQKATLLPKLTKPIASPHVKDPFLQAARYKLEKKENTLNTTKETLARLTSEVNILKTAIRRVEELPDDAEFPLDVLDIVLKRDMGADQKGENAGN